MSDSIWVDPRVHIPHQIDLVFKQLQPLMKLSVTDRLNRLLLILGFS
jgi:hypothetical protein